MTENEFWKALGDVFLVSDVPCSLCPAFIYNDCCARECGVSCKKSLETVYRKIVEDERNDIGEMD